MTKLTNNKKSLKTWKEFIWYNTLNPKEYLSNIFYKIIIDLFFERWLRSFGDNPVATNFVRDLTGLPSAITAVIFKLPIGNSHIQNDIGQIMFSVTKITCKSTVIAYHYYHLKNSKLEFAGRLGNYICDPLGGIFRQGTIERQEQNKTDVNYFYYVYKNFKLDWIYKATTGGIPKVFVSDIVGEIFKQLIPYKISKNVDKTTYEYPSFKKIIKWSLSSDKLDYMSYRDIVKSGTTKLDTTIKHYILPDNDKQITLNNDIWDKLKIIDSPSGYFYPTASLLLATNIIGKVVEDIIPGYSICTASRCTQTYIENALDNQLYHNGTNIYSDTPEL